MIVNISYIWFKTFFQNYKNLIVDISYIEDVNPFTSLNNIKCDSKLGNIYKEDVNDGKMALVDWTATALIDNHILYTGKK